MKKVGTAMYVHKSNSLELFNKISNEESERIRKIINNFKNDFAIIKYDKGKLSLIESENWDSANEPDVGKSYCFQPGEVLSDKYKIIKSSGKIYHNKWMFVSVDYEGFNIEEAKNRTKLWNSIPGIKEHKSKIGNKSYWIALLKKNNIEI